MKSRTKTGRKPAGHQAPVTRHAFSAGPADPRLIEDLVAANRILAKEGVLDGYGLGRAWEAWKRKAMAK